VPLAQAAERSVHGPLAETEMAEKAKAGMEMAVELIAEADNLQVSGRRSPGLMRKQGSSWRRTRRPRPTGNRMRFADYGPIVK
jgi:hypothetical protein